MSKPTASSAPFVGVQLGSHSVYDEGIDHVLDTLQRTARVNAVFVYSQTYQLHMHARQFWNHRPREQFADHGVPFVDPSRPDMSRVWVKTDEGYYGGTCLRQTQPPDRHHAGKDVLEDLREPCERRGIKLFARILEACHYVDLIPNFPKIMAVDVFGRKTDQTCLNHPDYKNWWLAVVEDLLKSHPYIAGLKYGQERSGPLDLLQNPQSVPHCFCEHCRERAERKGIDVDRAIRGWRELYELAAETRAGGRPRDGYFVSFLRLFLLYPEIFAWDQMWFEGREDIRKQLYGTVKLIDPQKTFGLHMYHWLSFNPFIRAEADYREVRRYADWIKPVVYPDCASGRLRGMLRGYRGTLFGDLDWPTTVRFFHQIMGLDADKEVSAEELEGEDPRGFTADYVYRETRRAVEGLGPDVPVYAGVGFDVPGPKRPSKPEDVYAACKEAFRAGAKGLLLSREYDEMRLENLSAVGRLIDEMTGGSSPR